MVAESIPDSEGTESRPEEETTRVMKLFDSSLVSAGKLVESRVLRLRDRHPNATDVQLVKKLETSFLSSVTASGAATGGAAAVPGVGTVAVVASVGVDTSWFMTASAAHVLSVLRVHGIEITDLEHQKAVVLTVLAGGGGSTFMGKAAGRTGAHLGKLLTKSVPLTTIRSVNRVLGVNFVTKWGTQQGLLVIGKAAPFGIGMVIGASGNLLMAKGITKATQIAVETALGDLNSEDRHTSPTVD
ncbi:hypothetical protein [Rhodococcus opacus]|uniref:hypothetical protein n=1 Tax=Rhodococcus opacus TaxID=37919 RepID=UPI002475461F|nr:hypothetical protein [Rhodococcus opacus]MDH6291881.1 hypothetical protein [Rhodococcus opacus]